MLQLFSMLARSSVQLAFAKGYKAGIKILQNFAKKGRKTLSNRREPFQNPGVEPQAGSHLASRGACGRGKTGRKGVLGTADIFLFEGYRLDRRDGGLFRRDEGGAFVPVAIGARALDVLGVLIERPGVLVCKDEIMGAVWPHAAVENANLTIQISTLRRVLDHGRPEGSCIQTVAAQGYRFVAPVTRVERTNSFKFLVPAEAIADVPMVSSSPATAHRQRIGLVGTAMIVAAAILVAIAVWWLQSTPISSPAPSTASALVSWPTSTPRPSIVVLPFANLGEDREPQYLADAIADDVTSDLSRIADLFVISRNTAFTYRDKPVDTKQIGRELGVRYLLQGSVRRSGNQLRVDTQLIDAETDAHLWAERFHGNAGDLFAVQNEITSRIAIALNTELVSAEAARPMERPDALNYLMRGRAALWKSPTPESYAEAVGFFERALTLEPASVEAQSLLAVALSARALYGNDRTAPVAADIARADQLAGQALTVSPRSLTAHYAKGWSLHAQRRWEEAIPEYETVIALNRNSVSAIANLGWCKFWTGSLEEAIALYEQVMRLSPRDPNISFWYFRIGLVRLLQSRAEEAIVWFTRARGAAPEYPFTHSSLASAYALTGDSARARIELAEAKRLVPDNRYSSITRLKAISYLGPPKIRSLFETTFLAGLRKAGLPED
jgi:adenylate cyclase